MSSCEFERVVERNLTFYDTIKPQDADKFYTVIATLNDARTKQLIALATGTQANNIRYEDDIEDCHAESLLKRAYKRYLIDAALNIISETQLTKEDRHSKFLSQFGCQELTLFVSQFPCGLIKRFQGTEPIDEETGAVLKRKPGRGCVIDGKTIYVQRDNCLNKLERWTKTYGFHGKVLNNLLGVRCKLSEILIGDCEPDVDLNYEAHLESFKKLRSDSTTGCHLVKMRRDEFVFNSLSNRRPLPVSTIYWASPFGQAAHSVEYLVDGRKNGVTKKHRCSGHHEFKLKIGNYHLRSDLSKVCSAFLPSQDQILNLESP